MKRKACLAVFKVLYVYLCHWLAPVLCFTSDEAWSDGGGEGNIHLSDMRTPKDIWYNKEISDTFNVIRMVRGLVLLALEQARSQKLIGSSLEAAVTLYMPKAINVMWGELCIVSTVTVVEGVVPTAAVTVQDLTGYGVVVNKALGQKCERCWQVLADVGTHPVHPAVCHRCADVVEERG
jgi:isoleucyl-tRNA synthetase